MSESSGSGDSLETRSTHMSETDDERSHHDSEYDDSSSAGGSPTSSHRRQSSNYHSATGSPREKRDGSQSERKSVTFGSVDQKEASSDPSATAELEDDQIPASSHREDIVEDSPPPGGRSSDGSRASGRSPRAASLGADEMAKTELASVPELDDDAHLPSTAKSTKSTSRRVGGSAKDADSKRTASIPLEDSIRTETTTAEAMSTIATRSDFDSNELIESDRGDSHRTSKTPLNTPENSANLEPPPAGWVCTDCVKDVNPEEALRCVNCDWATLCDNCCNLHARKTHELRDYQLQPPSFCSVHDMIRTLYCEDCDATLCLGCLVDHSKGHTWNRIPVAHSQMKKSLETSMGKCERLCETVKARHELLQSFVKQSASSSDQTVQEYNSIVEITREIVASLIEAERNQNTHWDKELNENERQLGEMVESSIKELEANKKGVDTNFPQIVPLARSSAELETKLSLSTDKLRVQSWEYYRSGVEPAVTDSEKEAILREAIEKVMPVVDHPTFYTCWKIPSIARCLQVSQDKVFYRNGSSIEAIDLTTTDHSIIKTAHEVCLFSISGSHLFYGSPNNISVLNLDSETEQLISEKQSCFCYKLSETRLLTLDRENNRAVLLLDYPSLAVNTEILVGITGKCQPTQKSRKQYVPAVCCSRSFIAVAGRNSQSLFETIQVYDPWLRPKLTINGVLAAFMAVVRDRLLLCMSPSLEVWIHDLKTGALVDNRHLTILSGVFAAGIAYCDKTNQLLISCTDSQMRGLVFWDHDMTVPEMVGAPEMSGDVTKINTVTHTPSHTGGSNLSVSVDEAGEKNSRRATVTSETHVSSAHDPSTAGVPQNSPVATVSQVKPRTVSEGHSGKLASEETGNGKPSGTVSSKPPSISVRSGSAGKSKKSGSQDSTSFSKQRS